MGSIISSRSNKDGKIIYEIELDYAESLHLKGHIKKVCLFSEDACDAVSKLSSRGTHESTKYFLVPKELRANLTTADKVKCQKIITDSKMIFIYVLDRVVI